MTSDEQSTRHREVDQKPSKSCVDRASDGMHVTNSSVRVDVHTIEAEGNDQRPYSAQERKCKTARGW